MISLRLRSGTCDTAGWQCASFRFSASMCIAAERAKLQEPALTNLQLCMKFPHPRPKRVSGASRWRLGQVIGADESLGKQGAEYLVGLADAVLHCDRAVVAEEAAYRLIRQCHREGQGVARNLDLRLWGNLSDQFHRLLDRGGHAIDVEYLGAVAIPGHSLDERAGDLARMQPGNRSAKRNGVGLAGSRGEDRDSRFRSHALIAAHAVDDAGAEADAGNLPVLRVDPGGLFVGELVGAVERRLCQLDRRARRLRSEDVDGADDVDFRAGNGICFAEWN